MTSLFLSSLPSRMYLLQLMSFVSCRASQESEPFPIFSPLYALQCSIFLFGKLRRWFCPLQSLVHDYCTLSMFSSIRHGIKGNADARTRPISGLAVCPDISKWSNWHSLQNFISQYRPILLKPQFKPVDCMDYWHAFRRKGISFYWEG